MHQQRNNGSAYRNVAGGNIARAGVCMRQPVIISSYGVITLCHRGIASGIIFQRVMVSWRENGVA